MECCLRLFKVSKEINGFAYLYYQKQLEKVKNIKFHENGGELRIKSDKDLSVAIESVRESYNFIRQAIKDNVNTGWYAVTPKEKITWLKSPEDDEETSEEEK